MSRKQKATLSARDKFGFLEAAIADPDLSAAAKVVLVVLLLKFRNSKTGRCNPGTATIAKAVGRSRRAVVDTVAELRESGWLKTISTRGGSARNTNKFVFDLKQREPVSSTAPVSSTVPVQKKVQTSVVHCPRILEEPPAPKGAGGVCVILPSSAAAPCGAALEEKEENGAALAGDFESLCLIWRKPHGINKAAAWKTFQAVCSEHPAEQILASAGRWVAATPPRYLKKLEEWLGNGAWRNDPPARGAESTGRRRKEDPVEAMMRAGGWEPIQ